MKKAILTCLVAVAIASALWLYRQDKVPEHIVLVFSSAQRRLWIAQEKRTDSVKISQGGVVLAMEPIHRAVNVAGTGTLSNEGHIIVVREDDVLVDGSSLKKSNNWVLFPDGRLAQGLIRTFD